MILTFVWDLEIGSPAISKEVIRIGWLNGCGVTKASCFESGEFGLVEGGAAAIGLGLSPAEKISAGATELLKPYIVKRFMAILQPVMLFALAVFFPIFF